MTWVEEAACRDHLTPELWFADLGSRAYEAALRFCRSCPVRAACLRHALEKNEQHGIWGGVDQDSRRQLRRQARCGTRSGYVTHQARKERACEDCRQANTEYIHRWKAKARQA